MALRDTFYYLICENDFKQITQQLNIDLWPFVEVIISVEYFH